MEKYLSTSQVAERLGISRVAVFKRIKAGKLEAIRLGRNYFVHEDAVSEGIYRKLDSEEKKAVDEAVKRAIRDYGDTLKWLAEE